MAKIGIFWIYHNEVIGKAIDLKEGEENIPGIIDSPDTHVKYWEMAPVLRSPSPNLEELGMKLCQEGGSLREVIRERKVASPYVFCDDRGRPYTPSKVSMAFRRVCKRAGVDNLRWHDLRHDFATLMLRKTRNLVDVQHAMGH
jgi:hypothetical protein